MNRKARSVALRPEIEAEVPDTAFVLAAGLGKRMRPLTASRPKPLVELGGKALIDHVLDRLRSAGVRKIVVNVHYLADALEAHLKARANDFDVQVSDERKQLMETGGGLILAEPMIHADPFLVINSDNFWIDGPSDTLHLLASLWREEDMDALLLLVPQARAGNHRGQGDFHMTSDGGLVRREKGKVAPFVFTGIQMVSKRLLRDAPEGPFSTNVLWDQAIADGRCFGAVHHGLWFDVGNPAAIKATERALEHG